MLCDHAMQVCDVATYIAPEGSQTQGMSMSCLGHQHAHDDRHVCMHSTMLIKETVQCYVILTTHAWAVNIGSWALCVACAGV